MNNETKLLEFAFDNNCKTFCDLYIAALKTLHGELWHEHTMDNWKPENAVARAREAIFYSKLQP